MVFLVRTTLPGAENIGKEKKTDRRKTLKNEEKNEECRKTQITTINIFGFTLHIKKYTLLENIV